MAYKPFDLTGKVALVTGGNGGIGLGMAEAHGRSRRRHRHLGHQRREERRREGAARSAPAAGSSRSQCDVGDEAEVEAAFAETLDVLGRVDGCFANAGVGGGAARPSLEMYHRDNGTGCCGSTCDGAFLTFRAAAQHMVARAGRATRAACWSAPPRSPAIEGAARNEHYGATKGGMISMVRALAVELARYGVRANSILPGWIETDMTASAVANDPKFARQRDAARADAALGQPAPISAASRST